MTGPRIMQGGWAPDGPSFGLPEGFTRIPKMFIGRAKQFFVYGSDFLPATASATTTQTIQINADADFLIIAGEAIVTDTLNTTQQTFWPALVSLKDSGSGRDLFNTAQHFHLVFGDAQEPAYWTLPYVLGRSSSFAVSLQNLEATDRNVRVGFYGFKVFDMPEEEYYR